jgi:hypothetical protein
MSANDDVCCVHLFDAAEQQCQSNAYLIDVRDA